MFETLEKAIIHNPPSDTYRERKKYKLKASLGFRHSPSSSSWSLLISSVCMYVCVCVKKNKKMKKTQKYDYGMGNLINYFEIKKFLDYSKIQTEEVCV